jgi:hypothetical protein
MNILEKINKTADNKKKDIMKILELKKYNIGFYKNNKPREKMLEIYDNNQLILRGEYNFYGIYQQTTKLWIWASSIPGVELRHIKNINKLKESNYLFESDENVKTNFYYQLLTQDVLYITNELMLEWINELILYLSNDIYYFNPENSEQNIQFITLMNIREKFI